MLTLGALAVIVGLTLGLLGGGGSILAVPLLLYVGGLEPKSAIASSLAVIALASAATLIGYARRHQVRWRVGLVFGSTGMLGAFVGGRVAEFIPSSLLLVGFAGMMLATAIAMLRPRGSAEASPVSRPSWFFAVEGSVVGLVTGMVGAGGGFLVVPALVILGRVPMREAVGTSLLVIALKSAAGFAGYATHTVVDYSVILQVAAWTSVGALVGGRLSQRIQPAQLRAAFGWFVVVMALYMFGKQLVGTPLGNLLYDGLFVDRWPWWVGGGAIGSFVLLFLWHDNHLLGVSTGFAEMCGSNLLTTWRTSWRPRFLLGIVLGGAVAGTLAGNHPSFAFGGFDTVWSDSLLVKALVLVGAGMLIGFGARSANGCTSGHAIVGVAQGAKSSLVATAGFMVAGFAAANVVPLLARLWS